jgi:hypothetical protein
LGRIHLSGRFRIGARAVTGPIASRVVLHAPAESVARRIPPGVGLLGVVDGRTCVLATGVESWETLTVHLAMLGVDFDVSEPPDLVDHVRELAARYARATARGTEVLHPASLPPASRRAKSAAASCWSSYRPSAWRSHATAG